MVVCIDIYDLGFIIMFVIWCEWEFMVNLWSFDIIIYVVYSFILWYIVFVGVICSWDLLFKKEIQVIEISKNVIIIIDSFCNFDLLYYVVGYGGVVEVELVIIVIIYV